MAKNRKRAQPAAPKELLDKVIAQLHRQPTEGERFRLAASNAELEERLKPGLQERGAEQLRVREHPDFDSKRRGFVEVVKPVVSLTQSPAVTFRAEMRLHDGAPPYRPKEE